MSLYGRVFAAGYDKVMAGSEKAGLGARRQALLGRVGGRVVEIGAGTGANLRHYGPAVTELVLTEPEEPMARRLERKVSGCGLPARVVHAPAERLPLEDASFDYAISTLVLCTVKDPTRAIAELRRVLKPGGELIFLEHVLSDDPSLARWQNRLNGVQQRIGHGCNCNRRTLAGIEAGGFALTQVERSVIPKAYPIVRPLVLGAAQRA